MRVLVGPLLAGVLAMSPVAPAAAKPVLPWIADDFPRAMAMAKARKLPVFVESWAPW